MQELIKKQQRANKMIDFSSLLKNMKNVNLSKEEYFFNVCRLKIDWHCEVYKMDSDKLPDCFWFKLDYDNNFIKPYINI